MKNDIHNVRREEGGRKEEGGEREREIQDYSLYCSLLQDKVKFRRIM